MYCLTTTSKRVHVIQRLVHSRYTTRVHLMCEGGYIHVDKDILTKVDGPVELAIKLVGDGYMDDEIKCCRNRPRRIVSFPIPTEIGPIPMEPENARIIRRLVPVVDVEPAPKPAETRSIATLRNMDALDIQNVWYTPISPATDILQIL